MEKEYILVKDAIEILKRVNACLTFDDWTNAKEYINLEIKNLQKEGKIRKNQGM